MSATVTTDCKTGSAAGADLGIAAIRVTNTPDHLLKAAAAMLPLAVTFGYPPVLGLEEVRQAVATDLSSADQVPIEWTNVAIVFGARNGTNALIEFLAASTPGVESLGPQLAWPEYEEQAHRFGGKYLRIRGSEDDFYAPQAADFRSALASTTRCRLLIVTNPGNPIGNRYSAEQLLAIVELAHEHDLWLLVDEAYRDFVFDPQGHVSIWRAIKQHQPLMEWAARRLAVVQTLAKSYQCPSARGGILVAPAELIAHLNTTLPERTQAVPLVSQAMVQAAAEWPVDQRNEYLLSVRSIAEKNVRLVFEWASSVHPTIKPYVPKITPAAPLAFLDVSLLLERLQCDAAEVVRRLAGRGLKVVSGATCGDPKAIRLAVGQPTEIVQLGLQIFTDFLTESFP